MGGVLEGLGQVSVTVKSLLLNQFGERQRHEQAVDAACVGCLHRLDPLG